MVLLLVRFGADIQQKNHWGYTAFDYIRSQAGVQYTFRGCQRISRLVWTDCRIFVFSDGLRGNRWRLPSQVLWVGLEVGFLGKAVPALVGNQKLCARRCAERLTSSMCRSDSKALESLGSVFFCRAHSLVYAGNGTWASQTPEPYPEPHPDSYARKNPKRSLQELLAL